MSVILYRIFQFCMRIAAYFLPWREPSLISGEGSLEKLPERLSEMGIDSVLVVTDEGLAKIGLPARLYDALTRGGVKYVVYDRVVSNPTINNIEQALELYKHNHCTATIAFGGGSPIDCAKIVCARAAKPNQNVREMKGMLRILRRIPPIIAVPTTAGTGSETTLAAVITDSENHYKYPINDPALIPRVAVLDPTLTVGLPPKITATTGLDALCHAVEAYIGRSNTKKTRDFARRAVTLIFENLYAAYLDGNNLVARHNMQEAAYLAGGAFTRAYVGYVHAVAHSLGGMYGIAHGLANAVIMPYVLRAFGEKAHKPLAELAELVGLTGETNAEKAESFIAAIEDMNKKMGIPDGFEEICFSDIPILAGFASAEANPNYPVPRIMKKDELEKIYVELKR